MPAWPLHARAVAAAHFQVRQGQRVATSTLRALWRDEDQFETLVTELKPKQNEPRNGVRAVNAKRKRSEEQEDRRRSWSAV